MQPEIQTLSMKKTAFFCGALISLWGCAERNLPEPATAVQAPVATASARMAAPAQLTFTKSISDAANFTWSGAVSGDVEGGLVTQLISKTGDGTIWHVEFDWIVSAGEKSFTARLRGILNNQTGKVVMNGTVSEGWLKGAQVHEEGQLVNPANLGFTGTIRIMTATAK
jgi:hypothetical protein